MTMEDFVDDHGGLRRWSWRTSSKIMEDVVDGHGGLVDDHGGLVDDHRGSQMNAVHRLHRPRAPNPASCFFGPYSNFIWAGFLHRKWRFFFFIASAVFVNSESRSHRDLLCSPQTELLSLAFGGVDA